MQNDPRPDSRAEPPDSRPPILGRGSVDARAARSHHAKARFLALLEIRRQAIPAGLNADAYLSHCVEILYDLAAEVLADLEAKAAEALAREPTAVGYGGGPGGPASSTHDPLGPVRK